MTETHRLKVGLSPITSNHYRFGSLWTSSFGN